MTFTKNTIKDKVSIVGIGESAYYKRGQSPYPEFQLALQAILAACEDAGLDPKQIDGFASYSNDRNDPIRLSAALGIPQIGFSNMFWGGGGGGGSGAVANACAAVVAGYSNYVVAYRSLAQGQFGRFGQSGASGGMSGAAAYSVPFGVMSPAQSLAAMQAQRHMHEYGTTQDHFGAIALASYNHAQHNPRAVMYGRPLTMQDYHDSRWIVEPLHLFDCCQETDGAAAVIITTPERARDLNQTPVHVMAAAQGSGYRYGAGAMNRPDILKTNHDAIASNLWEMAEIGPADIDVAQFYENFTPLVLMSIEDYGFCEPGEGGAFVEDGNIEWPNGSLPINTSGGNLAEAYTHGFEFINETVRQLRGESTCQVQNAEIGLVASGPGVAPLSSLILRR
jgi:acetyl-CoA acetyltransferase